MLMIIVFYFVRREKSARVMMLRLTQRCKIPVSQRVQSYKISSIF